MTKKLSGKCVKGLLSIAFACFTLLLVASTFPHSAYAATTNLYASPTGSGTTCSSGSPCSLTGAQTKVRTLNTGTMTGNIVVNLQGGTYTLASTFALTDADSGNSGYKVIYQNDTGAAPVISGGTQITGWTLHDSTNNIWQASVSSSLRFRQLYVNGTRDIRARTPNAGSFDAATTGMSSSSPYTFGVTSSELASWGNLSQVEVVMLDHWAQKRVRISSYSGGTISFQSPESTDVLMNFGNNQSGTPHYYENAYEFIDAEGEWYLNTSTNILYYKPRSGETMSSATVIAPNLTNLVTVTGANNTTNMASNITITGITFQYSNWTDPSSYGFLNWQAAAYLESNSQSVIPGAIQVKNVNNLTFNYNTIQHTGAHGIVALDDTKNSSFDHNTITDTSAGGIYLDLTTSNSSYNNVTYNTVTYGGLDYSDAVGIFLYFAPYAVVNHNEVAYYRYTGISAGFDWTTNATAATNIEVGYNYVHNVMLLHDDGAGIYTLGNIPNMNIHDNYVQSLSGSSYNGGYPIAGIYLDNGSTGKTVQNNVLESTVAAFYAYNPPNYGNTIQNNYYNSTLGTIAGGNTVTGNTAVSGSWPTAAQTIINNAGTGATTTIVDDLNDWSKTFSHTANLNFDGANSSYLGGDTSRASRTTSTYENIVYSSGSGNTMTSLSADTWFWPSEAIVDFNIYTSPDNSTYTAFTPTKTTVTATYPVWTKVTYSGNLPAGTKYVKIEFRNTSATSWNPQIGKVTYTVSSPTITDNLNDWSKTFSHTANLNFDGANSSYLGGDTSRAARTTSTYENVIYSSGSGNTMASFSADTWFWPSEAIVDFIIYTSPDNSTYTAFTPTKTTVTATYPNWPKVTYSGNPPAGTKYIKIEFRNTSTNSWNPQIGSVSYNIQ